MAIDDQLVTRDDGEARILAEVGDDPSAPGPMSYSSRVDRAPVAGVDEPNGFLKASRPRLPSLFQISIASVLLFAVYDPSGSVTANVGSNAPTMP